MLLGCPVLARDIDGNRALVEEGKTGLLFRTQDEFQQQLERLPALRSQLVANAHRLVSDRYGLEAERNLYCQGTQYTLVLHSTQYTTEASPNAVTECDAAASEHNTLHVQYTAQYTVHYSVLSTQ
jgi:hypothetical protein